jgi:excisionase family DNA binding protein
MLDALAERVVSKLEQRIPLATRGSKRLLDTTEAAAYIGRSKTALHHLIRDNKLPVVRMDRRVFFDTRDLDAWIEQNRQRA